MKFSWQNENLSLGERCVEFARVEMINEVAEDKPNSFTSTRIREYFKICTRLVNGKESSIGLTFNSGNWCSAGVSFCLKQSLLPGETPPHGYRLGVVEVIADMQRFGTYRTKAQVKQEAYQIKIGDLVFFDRSNPNNPASAWWRHIGIVYSVNGNKFVCISGNNSGKWRLSNHQLTQSSLLGFGIYPFIQKITVLDYDIAVPIDWDNIDINSLAPHENTGKGLNVSVIFSMFDKFLGKK